MQIRGNFVCDGFNGVHIAVDKFGAVASALANGGQLTDCF